MASNIEARLAALEEEVAKLKAQINKEESEPWWEQIAGTFENDPIYAEAMKLGRKYRESTRPRKRKKRKSKNGDS